MKQYKCLMVVVMLSLLVLPCKANENVQIAAKTALTNLTTRSLGKLYRVRDQTETSEERETVLKACVAGLHAIGDTKNAAKVAGELDGDDFLLTFTTECSGCNGEGSTQTPCSKCKGTGGCQNRKCEEGMVTHSGFDGRSTTRKCPVCGGTAQCNSCNGSGSVSVACQKCRGAKLAVRKEKAKISCRELLKRLSNPSLGGDEDRQENGAATQDVCEAAKNKTEKRLEMKEQEDANTMYNRGKCYDDGDGVQTNPVEAVKWYRKAAELGHVEAQYMLGHHYDYSDGVEYTKGNVKEAMKWYLKAAEQGCARAQLTLGYIYTFGRYGQIGKDPVEAVKWYRKAAEQGDAMAQYELGLCYGQGNGVERSLTKAKKWYCKAAKSGHGGAQRMLGFRNLEGTPEDLVEAVEWYRKAAAKGQTNAQFNLGVCYEHGIGVLKDPVEAVKWFRMAAVQGDDKAQVKMGVCYGLGFGVSEDQVESVKWLRRAAKQGNDAARDFLKQTQGDEI